MQYKKLLNNYFNNSLNMNVFNMFHVYCKKSLLGKVIVHTTHTYLEYQRQHSG